MKQLFEIDYDGVYTTANFIQICLQKQFKFLPDFTPRNYTIKVKKIKLEEKEECDKPPIGLLPQSIFKKDRFNDVCSAISRYYNAGYKIPVKWIDEYNSLLDEGVIEKENR